MDLNFIRISIVGFQKIVFLYYFTNFTRRIAPDTEIFQGISDTILDVLRKTIF